MDRHYDHHLEKGDVGSCESEYHRHLHFCYGPITSVFWFSYWGKSYTILPVWTVDCGGWDYDAIPTRSLPFRNHGHCTYWWKFRGHVLFSNTNCQLNVDVTQSLVVIYHKSLGSDTQKAYRIMAIDVIAHLQDMKPNIYAVLYSRPVSDWRNTSSSYRYLSIDPSVFRVLSALLFWRIHQHGKHETRIPCTTR